MRGNTGYQAPADGRLAAAIATISDNRFPIRDRVERNRELIRRIELSFSASIRNEINHLARLTKMATAGMPVEIAAKIATDPPRAPRRTVNLLSRPAPER
jgi:hypothetical protein